MASLSETYPAFAERISALRGMGASEDEIGSVIMPRVRELAKLGFSTQEINEAMGAIKAPSFGEMMKEDLGKLGARAKELIVDQPAARMQRGGAQLKEAVTGQRSETLAGEEPENRAMNVIYGLGNIALSPLQVLGGAQKLAFGDPLAKAYENVAPEKGLVFSPETEKELVSMFGEVAGGAAVTKSLLAVPGMASRLFAEVFGYGKPAEANNVRAFQETLAGIEYDRLKDAEKVRVKALKEADQQLSKWVEELTGKPGAKVLDAVESTEEAQFQRFVDVEPSVGRNRPPADPATPPKIEAPDVMAQARDEQAARVSRLKAVLNNSKVSEEVRDRARAELADLMDAPAPKFRTEAPAELPPYPRDVTPGVGATDPVSLAERELFEQQRAAAMVKRAAEGSEFMGEQYIDARATNEGVPDFTRQPIPRGEGQPRVWRQGPDYGGSVGRRLAREETPGGTAREPARLGLPEPAGKDPLAAPKLPDSSPSLVQERIRQIQAENAKLRADYSSRLTSQKRTAAAPGPAPAPRAPQPPLRQQQQETVDWLVAEGQKRREQMTEEARSRRIQGELRHQDLQAKNAEIVRDANMVLNDPLASPYTKEAALEKLRELGVEPEIKPVAARPSAPKPKAAPVETKAPPAPPKPRLTDEELAAAAPDDETAQAFAQAKPQKPIVERVAETRAAQQEQARAEIARFEAENRRLRGETEAPPPPPKTPEPDDIAAQIREIEERNLRLRDELKAAEPEPKTALTEKEALEMIDRFRKTARAALEAEGVKKPTAKQIEQWLNAHPEVTGADVPRALPPEPKPAEGLTHRPFEFLEAKTPPPAQTPRSYRPAIRINGKEQLIGEAGQTTHAQVADAQAAAFEAYLKNPDAVIETGWVDNQGRWFDTAEEALSADKSLLELVKGSLSETGTVGALSPEQLAKEMQARADRAELYRRVSEAAKTSGRKMADVAADMGLTPTMYKRLVYEHTMDNGIMALGKAADKMTQLNERAKLIWPENEQIAATGHLTRETRDILREESWGGKKPITYNSWISQKMKDVNENELVAVGRQMTEAVRVMNQMGDAITASEALNLSGQLKEFISVYNRLSNQRSKIQFAAGRIVESFKRPAQPFPEDVVNKLRTMGAHIEAVKKMKERVPIDSYLVESIGKILKERTWDALSPAERDLFIRNLVDSNRLNLFAPFSPVLDLISNTVEGGVQLTSGFMGDLVHAARYRRASFPNTAGMIRAIGIRRNANKWPGLERIRPYSKELEEGLGYTFGGEPMPGNIPLRELVHSPREWLKGEVFQTGQPGVFTRRANQASAAYDTLKGAVMYGKTSMDTAFKRLFGYGSLWREAYEQADRQGLYGVDKQRFVDNFWQNIPQKALDEAIANANRAGWNRPLSRAEEKLARSSIVKLFFDPFARWSFQFTRWAGEMLGLNPTLMRKAKAGTLSAEEATRYLTRTATGIGGVYALDRWFNENPDGWVDYSSGEWVNAKTGDRQRLSSFEPAMSALFLAQVIKGSAAQAMGQTDDAVKHFNKAAGAMRYASIPFLRAIYGDSGMLGGIQSQLHQSLLSGRFDRTRLYEEFVDSLNRAIPGQSILNFMKSISDPTLREGLGAKLPGVSYLKPARVDLATGGTIEPKQRAFGVELPAIGGTPFPAASRIMRPTSSLLSRYGLLEYRGPRLPIAGYRAPEAPEEVTREWQREFGKARDQIFSQALPAIRAQELRLPAAQLTPGMPAYENIRKRLMDYDAIAMRHATNIVNARHLKAVKLPRRLTVREQRSASEAYD